MSVAAAAGGAASALKSLLARKFLEQQEAARVQQDQIQNEQRAAQEARMMASEQADQAYRTGQLARQDRMDAAGSARQAQQDEIADTERRRVGNERGVQQMIGGLVQREGVTPTNRKQIIGMLSEIGKMPTDDLLKDPDAEDARAIKRAEATEGIQHRNRMAEIGATGAEARKTAAHKTGDGGPSPYAAERSIRTLQSVDELLPKVSSATVGFGTDIMSKAGGTPARNFRAELETLKSNIITSELTAMREASKTGGALGQVSDKEALFLSAALGGLDPGQSPENFKAQLKKIRGSIERWNAARVTGGASMSSHGGGGGGTVDYVLDANGNLVPAQ